MWVFRPKGRETILMSETPQGPAVILGVDRGRAMLEERVNLMLQRLRAIGVQIVLKTGERAIHRLLIQNEVLAILVAVPELPP
jgi:hypothetical protein